jgi:hypothetical protein
MKKSSKSSRDQIIDVGDIETAKSQRNREILKAIHTGASYRNIASDFGLTAAAISYIARQNGIVRRPGLPQL